MSHEIIPFLPLETLFNCIYFLGKHNGKQIIVNLWFLAVSMVLDSLDDIHCLQEPPLDDRDFLHSVLEDRQLRALLEVSVTF